MSAETIELQGVCAHLRVVWKTKQNENGTTSGWWECDYGCGTQFWPVPAPDWESFRQGGRDLAAGRVLPWRIAMLPLPRWAFSILFRVAPFTWGRRYRNTQSAKPEEGK